MRVIKCDLCSYQTSHLSHLKSHKLSVHSDRRPWNCTHPGSNYKFKLKRNLQRHLRLHESDPVLRKPFTCAFKHCNYRASQKCNLGAHVQNRHTPGRSRDFRCTLCSSRFYDEPALHAHIRNHLKEKIFECNYCNYKTHRSLYFRQHVGAVHEKTTFACSFAGCKFTPNFKSNLYPHLKRHNPDSVARRPFPCTFPACEFRAGNCHWLKEHIRTHHSLNHVKEFSCRLCQKSFYTRSSLNRHVRYVHLNEK